MSPTLTIKYDPLDPIKKDLDRLRNETDSRLSAMGHIVLFARISHDTMYGVCTRCGNAAEISMKPPPGCEEAFGPAVGTFCRGSIRP